MQQAMTLFRDSIVVAVSVICIDSNEGNETNMHFHISQINEADFLDFLGQSLEETTICTLSVFSTFTSRQWRQIEKESESSPGCSQIKKIMQLEDCHATATLLCQQLLRW